MKMNFYNNYKKLNPIFKYSLIILILLIFIQILYYYFNKYILSTYNKKNTKDEKMKDIANANFNKNECVIMLFYANWCPHCQNAKPEWDMFKAIYDNKEIEGHIIKFIEYDCSNHSKNKEFNNDTKLNEILDIYKVNSYPTIIYQINNNKYIYESKVSKQNLEKFLNEIIKKV